MTQWKARTGRLDFGVNLVSGRIPVGFVIHNNMREKGSTVSYSWKLSLPGKDRSGSFPTEDEAKAACEAAFAEWLVTAGLQAK